MIFNGKRISQKKFWKNFEVPEIEDIEDLYERFADDLIIENKYSEDAWCYIQDYGDGILIRSFLIRRKSRRYIKDEKPYYKLGDLCCNREVSRRFISKDGIISQCVNGYHFVCFQGLIFNNYNTSWEIKKPAHNYAYESLDIAFDRRNVVLGKINNIKYVYDLILNHIMKTNNKIEFFYLSHFSTYVSKYLKNPLYEIAFKMNYFGYLPKNKKLTPKVLVNAIKNNVADKLDVMFACNSLDYETFKNISLYHWNDITDKFRENCKDLNSQFHKFTEFMIKYAKNRGEFSSTTYNDYLQNLIDLDIDFSDEKLLNKSFIKDHERMYARLQEIKNQAKFNSYKRFVKKNNNFEFMNIINDEKFKVVIPTDLHDFISEAEQNHNCVYSNGYYKRMANKSCFICFIRKNEAPEKSYLTVELGTDYSVRQCYADHNSKADEEGRRFVDNLARIFKENKLFNNIKKCVIA